MKWIIQEFKNIPLILCGVFYAVLCIFSIVTGVIYMSGEKELNPVELSDQFVSKLDEPEKLARFTKTMGLVTFVVGIVQGLASFSILKGHSKVYYWIALGFTIFSICSVLFKLNGKISAFSLTKLVFYLAILIIMLLDSTKVLFF